jgi:hypothetical protein
VFIAHFEINRDEPEEMYFTAEERDPEELKFKAKIKKPIKFTVNKDMTFEVN